MKAAMGKRRRHTQFAGQWAGREIEMLESYAYRALSLGAHRVLSRIEIELAHHGGKDNGKLPVTYDDFQRYGIDRHAIGPAVRELVALGFIEITDPGRAGNREFRRPARYRLTYRPTKDDWPTNEWKSITTKEQADRVAKRARSEKKPLRGRRAACGLDPVAQTSNAPAILISDADLVTA
jgi:hypothetical protein